MNTPRKIHKNEEKNTIQMKREKEDKDMAMATPQ